MTQSFDEWYRDTRDITAKAGWDAGAASRQAEIYSLKQSHHGASIGHDVFIKQLKERHKAEIKLLEKEIIETQEFLNNQNHIKQTKIDELQKRIDVFEKHVTVIKNIHENEFNENSDTSWILGNLDGFFECLNEDLKGNKDD